MNAECNLTNLFNHDDVTLGMTRCNQTRKAIEEQLKEREDTADMLKEAYRGRIDDEVGSGHRSSHT